MIAFCAPVRSDALEHTQNEASIDFFGAFRADVVVLEEVVHILVEFGLVDTVRLE